MTEFRHDQPVLYLSHPRRLGESAVMYGLVDLGGGRGRAADAGGPTVPVKFLHGHDDVPRDELVPESKANHEAMHKVAARLNARTIAAWEAAKTEAMAEVRGLSREPTPGG